MVIDFHTHCFPDGLAEKALGKLPGPLGKIGGHLGHGPALGAGEEKPL